MLIAGESSGDHYAAQLVRALRRELAAEPPTVTRDYQPLKTSLEPRFFGAGGPQMAAAGVELAFDMTEHSVIGLSEVLKQFFKFRRLFRQLFRLALDRQPEAIICVDFSGFNRRFAQAIKNHVRRRAGWFHQWNPALIQYVSPQVWASRESRAYTLPGQFDLLLSIFAFEKKWYARRVPHFRVDFIGHPIIDDYQALARSNSSSGAPPTVVLLPGSRPGELTRHLPIMFGALELLRKAVPQLRARMVLPNERLMQQAKAGSVPAELQIQCGGLPEALKDADIAIAKSGTITVDCAYFGVPTVVMYRTSFSTYQVGKRLVKLKFIAMPNLLANDMIFPEFVQDAATAETIAQAALELLRDDKRRHQIKERLAEVVATLGPPGASDRAARLILQLVESRSPQPD